MHYYDDDDYLFEIWKGISLAIITAPIWLPCYCIWYLVKGRKEDKELEAWHNANRNKPDDTRISQTSRIPQEPWSKEKMEERANELVKKGDIEPGC